MAKRKSSKDVPYIKIAYIGGGSRGWAHTVMADLALCGELTGEIRLYDIDRPMAQLNARWGKRIVASPDARSEWKITVPKSLKEALSGVDFVFASIMPGPMELMDSDVGIPEKYGIVHPVGDTVGPAGLCRSLRAAPEYATIAKGIERYCPDAWVINYTNPMTVCTRTLYKVFPQIKAFGCCHGVFGTQDRLAELVKEYYGVMPKRDEIRLNVVGINHFTWATSAKWNDVDLLRLYDRHWKKKGMRHVFTQEDLDNLGRWEDAGQVVDDMWRRYGLLPAISGRHLVEFLPFYAKDVATLNRWGVRMTAVSGRIERYYEAPKEFRKRLADRKPFRLTYSTEEAVRQILAVLGIRDLHSNVNLPNVGQIDGLPKDVVVETNAFFTKDLVKPIPAGRIPVGVEALVLRHVSNQEMIVEAALTQDKHLAFQAFLNDPLMTLTTDKAWKMFNEMLKATRSMLPGWKI